MNCRVCDAPIAALSLNLPAPGLSSLTTPLEAPTQVGICRQCGHGQSPNPVELEAFYDNEYRISLQSDDFDQLHSVEDGKPVFRTQRQLDVLLGLVDIPDGAKVLDYGAAKAQSMRRLLAARPNIAAHVFDVSDDYRAHWQGWLPTAQTATYRIPDEWRGRFDLITTYFVLEHVERPTEHLRELGALLAPGGRIFAIVPDSLSNSGDVLVIDHVNHFTPPSVAKACALAGLQVQAFDADTFTGGLAFTAFAATDPSPPPMSDVDEAVERLEAACRMWNGMRRDLLAAVADRPGQPLALHGAGFYGSFVMQQLGGNRDLRVVLDANPHLQGTEFFGRPIVAPGQLSDDVNTVVIALNPSIARQIIGDGRLYGRSGVDLIFLDGKPDPKS